MAAAANSKIDGLRDVIAKLGEIRWRRSENEKARFISIVSRHRTLPASHSLFALASAVPILVHACALRVRSPPSPSIHRPTPTASRRHGRLAHRRPDRRVQGGLQPLRQGRRWLNIVNPRLAFLLQQIKVHRS